MNRREALASVSVLLGGALVGAEVFLAGCKSTTGSSNLFAAEDLALLDEIGEAIIPATPGAGGAKAAGISAFMQTIVTDCYTEMEQQTFKEGIATLTEACRQQYKTTFSNLPQTEKAAFLTALYAEAKAFAATDAYKRAKEVFDQQQEEAVKAAAARNDFGARYLKARYPPHYFIMMRQLTLWGYFSSETGMTKALRYVETPGRYDGAYPYKKGDKVWAM
ncbi:gluconate 2-dehydrogenase subunit 3 family protein [Niabella aurantiaca]|uniref:gluconate 2-dehydrogenase subunit 3 family protein n=1 Tax=Niabella aurantiaca TaxID=379900 RepID=UPI00036BC8F6|nr:gluconate 2-dehydrogenase subunit 3 family protein [Niabella aurantiaca]